MPTAAAAWAVRQRRRRIHSTPLCQGCCSCCCFQLYIPLVVSHTQLTSYFSMPSTASRDEKFTACPIISRGSSTINGRILIFNNVLGIFT